MTELPAASSAGQRAGDRLVVEWGGSALDEVDLAFAHHVLATALSAAADRRLLAARTWLLSVSFIGDEEMAALNGEYRGMPVPTDVLSFPQLEPHEEGAPAAPAGVGPEAPLILGDVVVSLPRAREQAAEYGHSLERELGFLLVHSVLHLLGHDHLEEGERRVMRAEEERILALLALTRDV